jgi:hypothetical protein
MALLNNEEARLEREKRMQRLRKQVTSSVCIKFSVNIPKLIHKQFKSAAASEGKDMKDILLANILKYLEKFV